MKELKTILKCLRYGLGMRQGQHHKDTSYKNGYWGMFMLRVVWEWTQNTDWKSSMPYKLLPLVLTLLHFMHYNSKLFIFQDTWKLSQGVIQINLCIPNNQVNQMVTRSPRLSSPFKIPPTYCPYNMGIWHRESVSFCCSSNTYHFPSFQRKWGNGANKITAQRTQFIWSSGDEILKTKERSCLEI